MKITLLQMAVALNAPAENCRRIERLLGEAMRLTPDVIVLPEMWNIGFFPHDPRVNADEAGRLAQAFLSELAKQYGVNIIGGTVASKEQHNLVNINYNFNRQGELISEYRKIHLFSPSGEDRVFSAGNKLSTFVIDGVKAAVVICYDIRFCELVRLLALEDIAVLFIPAAWPKSRLEHWQTLIKARAIENQFFVAGVNVAGTANALKFGGGSMIVDPWGKVVAKAAGEECCLSGELDLAVMRDIRQRINVFQDRRSSLYKLTCQD